MAKCLSGRWKDILAYQNRRVFSIYMLFACSATSCCLARHTSHLPLLDQTCQIALTVLRRLLSQGRTYDPDRASSSLPELSMFVSISSQLRGRILCDRESNCVPKGRASTHRNLFIFKPLTQLSTLDDAVLENQARGSATCQPPLSQTSDIRATRMSVLIVPDSAPPHRPATRAPCSTQHPLLTLSLIAKSNPISPVSRKQALEAVLSLRSALPPRPRRQPSVPGPIDWRRAVARGCGRFT